MLDTVRIRYPAVRLLQGADGIVPASAVRYNDGCCPDPLCVPFCTTACAFVDLLPTGPMWDRQKTDAIAMLTECGGGADPNACPSMANYAIYGAAVLHDMLENILQPTLREANPRTASATLDDWLDRYGWQDCFRSSCRSDYLAILSPYERLNDCGSYYCPTDYSDEFECAMKHAILLSLVRMQRGVIKNLDGINWVIEPLGARVSPMRPWPEDVQAFLAGSCETDGAPCFCDEVTLQICPTVQELPGCPDNTCGPNTAVPVSASQWYECGGEPPVLLYPAVIAAECIVRAMLPRKCPNILFQCQET